MRTLKERFEEKVSPEPNSGCHLWAASGFPHGYGKISVDGESTGAHRVAWELYRGAIPTGLHVLHRCDIRCCVNPDHLFLGTPQDNVDDKMAKNRGYSGSRHHNSRKTHCPQGHPFNEENTYAWTRPDGLINRYCRVCHLDHSRASYHRNR